MVFYEDLKALLSLFLNCETFLWGKDVCLSSKHLEQLCLSLVNQETYWVFGSFNRLCYFRCLLVLSLHQKSSQDPSNNPISPYLAP
jgi:hypothetical protein